MTTAYTSLLGLALPVTGELSGTWGDTVNDYITQYLDASVAGTQTISGSQTAVTLSKTTNASLSQAGSGATGSSQYNVINCTGNPASMLTVTVPAASKTYVVVNATSTNQDVKIVGAGPTTGVTLVAGERAIIAWNGSDFIKVATSTVDGVSTISFGTTGLTPSTATSGAVTVAGTLVAANGGTGQSSYTTGDLLYATGSTALSKLGIGTNGQILTSTGTAPQWSTLSGVAVTTFSAGTTGFTPSSATSGAITLAGTLATTNGGTGLTSFTANRVFYASSTSAIGQSANLTFDGTTLTAANFTDSSLTSGRVTYATTGGNLTDSANLLYSGTDLTVYGITVGRGAGAVSTNTAVGASALASNTTGGTNTAVGANSLQNSTADNNTAVGRFSMQANTTGASNTAMGSAVMVSNTTGSNNVAIGQQALQANTTASNNTAVGFQAAYSNTTTTGINAFGAQALYANTTGVGNSAFGGVHTGFFESALRNNTTGSNNNAFGSGALGLNSTGGNNSAFGYAALYSNTTASNNTAVGYQAGYSNTTGAGNVAVGNLALFTNATGGSSTAVGSAALRYATGVYNTALGENAGRGTNGSFTGTGNLTVGPGTGINLTTGNNNTFVGGVNSNNYVNAGAATTTGAFNAFVGGGAGGSNTTGSNNVSLGWQALFSNTTASNNTAVGYQAGYSNTTGTLNVFIGRQAGYSSNSTGPGTGQVANTIIGDQAAYSLTTGYGNTVIGAAAGYSLTTGTGNTIVGPNISGIFPAGYYMTTGSKNTILGSFSGNQGGLDIRTASNYIVLSDGDGNPRLIGDASGNFGIGTTSITNAKLKVSGNQNGAIMSEDTSGTTSFVRILGDAGSQNLINWQDGTALRFATSTQAYGTFAERARFPSAGGFQCANSISVGNVAPTTSGAGITFPATQSASSNANTLDDYEQGTFTPTVGGTWTTSPTNLSGTYVKIGRQVYITVVFQGTPVKATATSGWIDSLPFTVVAEGTGSVVDNAVGNAGNVLFANLTRMWLTANSFIAGSNYFSGTYLAAD